MDATSLRRWLDARGIDGEAAVGAWREWRLAHGLLAPSALAGIGTDDPVLLYYESLDAATLAQIGRDGDPVALQVLARRQLAGDDDPGDAITHYARASRQGSVGAMLELAGVFGSRADAAGNSTTGTDQQTLAVAWQLAALRRYGPAVTDSRFLADLRTRAARLPPEAVLSACARSLAIIGDLAASDRGEAGPAPPPVFVAPPDVHAGLPCEETAAPVTRPSAYAGCGVQRASDGAGAPVDVWLCPGD